MIDIGEEKGGRKQENWPAKTKKVSGIDRKITRENGLTLLL